MKKKVLAFLLASTMVIEPFSVASAADFSDGTKQEAEVQFSDDAEEVPEVENETDGMDQFSTDAVGESEESTEQGELIGDSVYVKFENDTATISGTGDMWDYYDNGYDYTNKHQNPFIGKSGIEKIIIEDGVTSVGSRLLNQYENSGSVENISLGKDIKRIGKLAFSGCNNIKQFLLPIGLEEIDESAFEYWKSIDKIVIPDTVKNLGKECFLGCFNLNSVELSQNLKDIPEGVFASCINLSEIELPTTLKSIGANAFYNCKSLTEIGLPSGIESIGGRAFHDCSSLMSITLPKTLKALGDDVFWNCTNLTTVNFEEGFSCNIPIFTFEYCSNLVEITIPKGVSNIEREVFFKCSRLSTVIIEGNTTKIDSKALNDCPNLRTIKGYDCSYAKKYYDSLNDDQKKSIKFESLGEGSHQFTAEKVQIKGPTCTEKGIKANKCNICGVIDESSKEEIPAYDHWWNDGVIIKPATKTEEGEAQYTCKRCNETKIEKIPKLSSIKFQVSQGEQGWDNHYQYSFYCTSNKDITYYVEYVKKDSGQPAYDNTKQNGKIRENGGTYIKVNITDEDAVDIYVFATDNTNGDYVCVKVTPNNNNRPQKPVIKAGDDITAIIAGDTLTLTGTGSTYNNGDWYDSKNNIKHIIVKDGVTSIGNWFFERFDSVNTIKLPTTLTSIGSSAFYGCYSLQNIVIPEGVTEIGNYLFSECSSLKSISFPSTLNTIPDLGGIGEDDGLNIENVIINKGIKKIGNNAFANLKNLKNITIPDSVTSIGEYAFRDCTELTNLLLPDSIIEIEGCAFSNCTSLDKIVLPNNLTSLGNDVFEYCNAEITFPSGLERIPELGMNATRKVNIPEGVKIIGEDAFWACSNLKEITLPSTITSIESGAFFNTSISGFNYPQNIDSIPINAFCGTKLTEFSVPPKVTEINDDAFYNCTDLVKISIPESVKYIGTDVFKNCRNLTIYGYKDTAAESYAKANNIKFISADYKVIFKDNGRTQKTEYVLEGENATPPSLKEKPGYTLSWDADYTNIQEDMVINAVWTKKDNGGGNTTIIVSPSETNKYTVTFKDRGKIVKTEKVKSGDAAEYPYINRNGYELSWDKDFSKVTANITVNAVWTVIKPNKITSLTAEVQKTSIDLSWDRAENTDYYLVYRKTTSDTEYKQIKKTTKILWTDEDVEPGTEYSYKVVGVCSVDGKKYQGADSDIVTAKIGTPQIGDVYSVGDLKYKVTGAKEVSVIGLAKEEVEIKIPSAVSISGKVYKVTAIQDKAFYQNEDIVSIAIGNNVTYVGKYAFYQCPNLETVKFGKRVAVISTCAFTQCPNLENVTLPSSIRKIGAKAFYQCTSIKVLKINGSALEYVGKKGLAVNKTVTLRLPKKVYTKYRKLIKASGVYFKTKFVKF